MSYVVENLAGKNYLEVKGVLEQMYGLTVFIDHEDATETSVANVITKTEPKAGTKLTTGDSITLFIPDMTTTYPDFTKGEYSLKQINEWGEKYKVVIEEVNIETDEYKPGTIYDQSQKAGTTVMANQVLRIYIAQEVSGDGQAAEEIDSQGNNE